MDENSGIEIATPPDWLVTLESRREKLSKGKLGHESGAGARCNDCGDKCPGLDLHFWRKVCRNCKCRKDQHACPDDDQSGWAQFEILGQIRSKPAYMTISKLTDKPVKVDWIPPNIDNDLVISIIFSPKGTLQASDYLHQLGSENIPISGSGAAAKRKQQLEFQVPPHDLDASLCHNLTQNEAAQLTQYVEKIRENCVGQGNVIRIVNPISKGKIHKLDESAIINRHPANDIDEGKSQLLRQLGVNLSCIPSVVTHDKILQQILNSKPVQRAALIPKKLPSILNTNSMPIRNDLLSNNNLSEASLHKLKNMKIDSQIVQSATVNGPLYDKLLHDLDMKMADYKNDSLLGPIKKFRKEYLDNDSFRNDIDKFLDFLNRFESFDSPKRAIRPLDDDQPIFNSPLPVKTNAPSRKGALITQETPIRKIKFPTKTQPPKFMLQELITSNQLPHSIKTDPIITNILYSDGVKTILFEPAKIIPHQKLILSKTPMHFNASHAPLSVGTVQTLQDIGIDSNAIHSATVNGDLYDALYNTLDQELIDYGQCKVLAPIKQFRDEYKRNKPFAEEIDEFTQPDNDLLSGIQSLPSGINTSESNDSGFDSKPPTPNYSTHPTLTFKVPATVATDDNTTKVVTQPKNIHGQSGVFGSIPGIEDMNMYPTVEPGKRQPFQIDDKMSDLSINPKLPNLSNTKPSPEVSTLTCKSCDQIIKIGDVAVKADRAGSDIVWHPQCFVCRSCGELLADLVYFYHAGNVYCGRDLAIILKIPRCQACDELIFTKEYTAAEGATFHIKHFCCYQCDEPLAGQQYVPDEKTGMPLCLRCYDAYHAERCKRCMNAIGPAEQGVAWGDIHWHGQCFICCGTDCGRSLLGGRFCVKQEMPFCSPKCVKSIIY